MKELPVRKPNRLKNYDYSQNGCYFITICVKDKHELLGQIDVGANCVRPLLSEHGGIVEKEIHVLSETYEAVEVDKYVVMPNHIHMVIVIGDNGRAGGGGRIGDNGGRTGDGGGRTQFAPTVSRIVKQFKGSITKQIGFSIWQRSFHDRIIRSEKEYMKIWRYIDENPMKWREDCFYPK